MRLPEGRAAAAVIAVALALALAVVAVDALAVPAVQPASEPVAQPVPTAGTWYCPVVAGEDEAAALTLAAVTEEPSAITVLRYVEGAPQVLEELTVPPGRQERITLEGEAARQPLAVRWRGGPAAATWEVTGEPTTAAACLDAPSPTWLVTGFQTSLGSRAVLHLFNPFGVDAVARVRFGTPEGPVDLVRTESVTVPAGQHVGLSLIEYQPELSDLAVTVEVLAGRLVAAGETAPALEGDEPAGRALLPAVPAPSAAAQVGYAYASEQAESWVSLYNPGEREAAVQVQVSAPAGGPPPEVSVPAGGVLRVDLAELSEASTFGVALTSVNDVPVVATRIAVIERASGPALVATVAGPPAERWALAGASGGIHIYNAGGQEAAVTVRLGDAEVESLTLAPNERGSVELDEPGALLVDADAPVAVEVRASVDGGLWSVLAVPARVWTGPAQRPPVRRDPGLVTRPADTPADEPAPPAPPVPATEASSVSACRSVPEAVLAEAQGARDGLPGRQADELHEVRSAFGA